MTRDLTLLRSSFICRPPRHVCLIYCSFVCFFFFSSRRRHTRFDCDWSSDVCSSDLGDDPDMEVDLLALLDSNLRRAPLAGFVVEGLSPYGRPSSQARHQVLLRAVCSGDRKSTRLNSSHSQISYAVFCLKKKKKSRMLLRAYGSATIISRCTGSHFSILYVNMFSCSGARCVRLLGLSRGSTLMHTRTRD